jgi:hypothetical protein
VENRTRERLLVLARFLFWAAALVLLLSVLGAIQVAGAESQLPGFEGLEREGRGAAALAALGGGLTAAGVLAGLGGILRALLLDRGDE